MTEPMTEAIARSIVQALSANFGPWEEDRRNLWLTKISDLEDGEAAFDAMQAMIETHEGGRVRFAEYRTAYLGARRVLSERRARERGIGDGRHFGIPMWVYVWKWARTRRTPPLPESVALPQQRPGYESLDADLIAEGHAAGPPPERYLTEEEYDSLHDEWSAAGAPRINPAT